MASGSDFAAQISAFCSATKERQTAVFRESVERVVDAMQTPVAAGGNMPIDTGFLRASLRLTKDAPISATLANPGGSHSYGGEVSLTLAGAEPGETLFACYGAAYAAAVNYGRNGKPGRMFVQLAAQRWPMIVNQVCADLQTRIQGASGGATPST